MKFNQEAELSSEQDKEGLKSISDFVEATAAVSNEKAEEGAQEELFVKLRPIQDSWACGKCPGYRFKNLDAAYKHVQRRHKGFKARTKPVLRTKESAQSHARKLSVHSSRRFRAKQRLSSVLSSGPAVEASPLSPIVSNIGVASCTGVVFKEGKVTRCKNRAITFKGSGNDRRSVIGLGLALIMICCWSVALQPFIANFLQALEDSDGSC